MKVIFVILIICFSFKVQSQNISAGSVYSLFKCNDNSVMGIGSNTYGELGDGSVTPTGTPINIAGLSGIKDVISGVTHTLFLKNNGTVWGCGSNDMGQLGDGTILEAHNVVQAQLPGIIQSISAGNKFSLFLKSDGKVLAVGANGSGQLGDGTNIAKVIPVEIAITDIKAISTGSTHSLFLKNDGTVWSCGWNGTGQLGDGTTTMRQTPVQVVGLSNIVAISAGSSFSFFLKNDGTIWATGENNYGQLGDGTNTNRSTPIQIQNLTEITEIATGGNHTLFLKIDGTVLATGNNLFGQIGDGTTNNTSNPILVNNVSDVTSISAGQDHSIFLKSDGTVWNVGRNTYGLLGDGNGGSYRTNVVQVLNLCQVPQYTSTQLNGVYGEMFIDVDANCLRENAPLLAERKAIIQPGNIIVETNQNGYWYLDSLPAGNYTITIDTTSNNWTVTCPITQNFTVISSNMLTVAPTFGFVSNNPCPLTNISLNMPFLRRCFHNQLIYIRACNQIDATGILYDGYSIVELDSNLIFENASIPFTPLGNNQYRFEHDSLFPGECVNYTISAQVSCDAILGQTLCMEANLYPVAACVLDSIPTPPTGEVSPCTLPWDQSSLSVDGWCANDSIYFTITNTGELGGGDMECYSPVRIFVDGVLIQLDSVLLQGGETFTYAFAGTAQTWILQADQHPLHPGNSHPNAHVENCGTGTWTPDLVNDLPLDDADPVVDIYCGPVRASYDPNDKRGFPNGIFDEHFIAKNQDLEYIIRFQNTGTDTAFTVVVRDTLDENFNIFTVTPGVSSHPYSFRMYGPRVLEWSFYNILLPDSTTNEPLSNGFLTFTVKQNPDLAEETLLKNNADIYFDFNEPIITNETTHKISYQINNLGSLEKLNPKKSNLKLYPNPTNSTITIDLNNFSKSVNYKIYTLSGKLLQEKRNSYGQKISIDVNNLENGLYFIEIEYDNKIEVLNFVKN